jgi:8-oxo-dGTP diphosphatase
MENIQQLFVAIKALIFYEGKILMLQESSEYEDGNQAGKWSEPGGRINPGEHWRDALLREIQEETGLEVEIKKPIGVDEWFPVIRGVPSQVVGTFFECLAKSDAVKLSQDHSNYKWFEPAEILELTNCTPETQNMVREYLNLSSQHPRSATEG